jgi:hemolysin III
LTPERPRLRGISHLIAAVVAGCAGLALVAGAPTTKAAVAAGIYAAGLTLQFATSAIYHRVWWRTARARAWMRHADHAAIFVCIAATYTPFALLVLHGWLGVAILIAAWLGAAAGVVRELAWPGAPRWLAIAAYVALGWLAIPTAPWMIGALGWKALLVLGGGLLYTAGALVYAAQRPDPAPTLFGYHEVFHALVVGAAALMFGVIAFAVVPGTT